MTGHELRLAVGVGLAVVVPAAVLHYSTPADRLAAGLTAAPFGWPWVLLVQLAAAVPAGLVLARRVRAAPALRGWGTGAWAAVGVVVAGLAAGVCPGVGDGLAEAGTGPVAALLLRGVMAAGLVLPWCAAATPPDPPPLPRPGLALAVALGLAVVPPGLYAAAAVAARTEQANDLLDRARLARAAPVVAGLCELGSDRPVAGRPAPAWRADLAKRLPALRRAADRPLPPRAPAAARIERAALLIQLDRPAGAADLLRPLVPADLTATMLLASVLRDTERWGESDALYRQAVAAALPRAAADPAAGGVVLAAVEGLAFNAREDGRPDEAEAALRRGLEALPGEAAYFHFQLGRHHADGGRPREALDHLRTAAALAPERFGDRAAQQIRSLRTTTYGCALSSP